MYSMGQKTLQKWCVARSYNDPGTVLPRPTCHRTLRFMNRFNDRRTLKQPFLNFLLLTDTKELKKMSVRSMINKTKAAGS